MPFIRYLTALIFAQILKPVSGTAILIILAVFSIGFFILHLIIVGTRLIASAVDIASAETFGNDIVSAVDIASAATFGNDIASAVDIASAATFGNDIASAVDIASAATFGNRS